MGHDLSKTVTIEDLQIGKKAVFTKTISESDVYIFGGISGDLGPHHVNEEYGKTTRFGARVVQGMLTASLTCAPLTELVAPGGLTMKYEYKFLAPVYIGDTITAVAEIGETILEKKRVIVRLSCTNQKEKVVLEGTALILIAIDEEAKPQKD
jgi:3-hydroxybutyryl-CoA dehydratase